MRHPSAQIPEVPAPDDLQMQFFHWLLERPEIPMLAAPANSGFYDDNYYARFTPEPSTGFFDEEYVSGKRSSFVRPNREFMAVNPSLRASPTYQEVCTAVLTTVEDIEHHEQLIYQEGFSPNAIRANIAHMLRHSDPAKHVVDFNEKDIPPPGREIPTKRSQLTCKTYNNQACITWSPVFFDMAPKQIHRTKIEKQPTTNQNRGNRSFFDLGMYLQVKKIFFPKNTVKWTNQHLSVNQLVLFQLKPI